MLLYQFTILKYRLNRDLEGGDTQLVNELRDKTKGIL